MAVTPVMILCRGHNNPLLKCKGMQKESEFYSSRSPLAYYPVELKKATSGKIHYCKTCVQGIFEYEFNKSNNMQKAVYYTCQRLDIPFIVDLFDESILKSKGSTVAEVTQVGKKLMGEYIARLNTNKAKYGTKIDFSCSDTVLSEIDTSLEEKAKTKKELERFQLDWGLQEFDVDYDLLEYDFYELTNGISLTKSQEMLYRDLCLARLSKRKAEQSKVEQTKGENIQRIQKQILDLMKTLKIDNFSENKELSVIERMLENRIAIQEKEKPAFYYDDVRKEANADFLGRGKYFYDHIYRSIKNQFVKNKQYNIIPKDKDTMSDSDYEKIMENGLDRKED